MKLVPFNVNVNAAPPAPIVVGEIVVSVGTGFAAVIVNVSAFDVYADGSALRVVPPKTLSA